MKLTIHRLPAILLLVTALLLAGGSAMAQSVSALGDNGVLYTVRAGTYGELFPEGSATDADNVVLELRVDRGDLGIEHHLVPGTEDDAVEVNPSLLAENGAGDVYLLWESWRGVLQSSIHLANLGEEGWTEPIEINGAPFVLKSSPRVLLTRDEFTIPDAEGNPVRRQRTVLHLVWVENGSSQEEQIVYSPLLLLDGRYVASGHTVVLNQLTPEPAAGAAASHAFDEPVLGVRSGADPRSVVIVFSDRRSQRLVSLNLRVLPGEISFLADEIHGLVAAQPGSATASTEGLASLADVARAGVESIGSFLQPVLRRELAAQLHGFIASRQPGMALESLADDCRDQLVGGGIDLTEPGIQRITGDERPHWIDLGYRPQSGGPGDGKDQQHSRSYQVVSRVATDQPAPAAILQPDVEVMASTDGEALALVWQKEGDLLYQETDGADGWGATNRLRLNAMAPEAARALVQNRIDKK